MRGHLSDQEFSVHGTENEVVLRPDELRRKMRRRHLEGGHEDDRRIPGPVPLAKLLRRLDSVPLAHPHVEQDDSEVLLPGTSEGFGPGSRGDNAASQLLEDGGEGKEVHDRVVRDQY